MYIAQRQRCALALGKLRKRRPEPCTRKQHLVRRTLSPSAGTRLWIGTSARRERWRYARRISETAIRYTHASKRSERGDRQGREARAPLPPGSHPALRARRPSRQQRPGEPEPPRVRKCALRELGHPAAAEPQAPRSLQSSSLQKTPPTGPLQDPANSHSVAHPRLPPERRANRGPARSSIRPEPNSFRLPRPAAHAWTAPGRRRHRRSADGEPCSSAGAPLGMIGSKDLLRAESTTGPPGPASGMALATRQLRNPRLAGKSPRGRDTRGDAIGGVRIGAEEVSRSRLGGVQLRPQKLLAAPGAAQACPAAARRKMRSLVVRSTSESGA